MKHIETLKAYNHFLKYDDPLHLPDCEDVTEALEYAIKEESRQFELLCDFFMFFRNNGEALLGSSIEQLVKTYLNNKEDE